MCSLFLFLFVRVQRICHPFLFVTNLDRFVILVAVVIIITTISILVLVVVPDNKIQRCCAHTKHHFANTFDTRPGSIQYGTSNSITRLRHEFVPVIPFSCFLLGQNFIRNTYPFPFGPYVILIIAFKKRRRREILYMRTWKRTGTYFNFVLSIRTISYHFPGSTSRKRTPSG